jgi:hypothetical protein
MTRLRILIKMASADAFELKAQALNKDARLLSAGISALKFTGDKNFIVDGEFSRDLPPPTAPQPDSGASQPDPTFGKRLRVVLRTTRQHAYELKAQALNNAPQLKDAGIIALKFVGDSQYLIDGEFSSDLPPAEETPAPKPGPTTDKKVRVVLRAPRAHAYELIAMHLNNDPALRKAGISTIGLAKGVGMVPAVIETPKQPAPVKKKRSLLRYGVIALIVGLIGVTGAGALFFASPPAPPTPQPTATEAAVIPVSGPATETLAPATATLVPPTATKVVSTKTQPATATHSPSPSATVVSCVPPTEVIVSAENLSCRYGPGATYLYRTGLVSGNVLDILGRADTVYGTWIRVQTRWTEPVKCWVNSGTRFVEIPQGDVACLEPLYPEKAPLIVFNTDLFPKPTNVEASRSGNLVFIQWQGYDLLPGDKPPNSPRYLVEMWTCQAGEMVFTPYGTDETFAQVQDDGGCDEPSRGHVYMAHVDGYIGPTIIPWPK